MRRYSFAFLAFLFIAAHPGAAQEPVDLSLFDPSSVAPDSWSPQTPATQISIQDATGMNLALQTSLKIDPKEFGLHTSLKQRLIGVLSSSQSLEIQRWEYPDQLDPAKSPVFASEVRAYLGFILEPPKPFLYEPFFHLKAGYESWEDSQNSGANPLIAHDIGLNIKLTPYFWLTLIRSDYYYGKDFERISYRRSINNRHYTSSEAYFTLAL